MTGLSGRETETNITSLLPVLQTRLPLLSSVHRVCAHSALGWIPFDYCPSCRQAAADSDGSSSPRCVFYASLRWKLSTCGSSEADGSNLERYETGGLEVAGARTSNPESIAIKIKTDVRIKLASPQRWKSESDNWFLQAALKSQMRTKNKKLPC